jgi:hypothetical protein
MTKLDRAGPAWLWSDEPIPDPLGRADKAVRFVRKLRQKRSGSCPNQNLSLHPEGMMRPHLVNWHWRTLPGGRRALGSCKTKQPTSANRTACSCTGKQLARAAFSDPKCVANMPSAAIRNVPAPGVPDARPSPDGSPIPARSAACPSRATHASRPGWNGLGLGKVLARTCRPQRLSELKRLTGWRCSPGVKAK